MGSVYLALMGTRGAAKPCVIKQVGSAWASTSALPPADFERRFHHEAEITLALSHPAIAKAYAYHKEPGPPFLVQELVDGLNLRDLVWLAFSAGEVIPVPLVAYVVTEMAGALAYVHGFEARALIHRDVTPENVMVSRTGDVKLIDFGVAKSTVSNSSQRSLVGKPEWIAPELFRGEKPDARVDTYALGMLAWYVLTRRDPAKTISYRDAMSFHVPPPSAFNSEVPLALDRIVEKALDPDPAMRFQTAKDLKHAFGHFLPKGYPARIEMAALVQRRADPSRDDVLAKFLAEGEALLDDAPTSVAQTPLPVTSPKPRKRKALPVVLVSAVVFGMLLALPGEPPSSDAQFLHNPTAPSMPSTSSELATVPTVVTARSAPSVPEAPPRSAETSSAPSPAALVPSDVHTIAITDPLIVTAGRTGERQTKTADARRGSASIGPGVDALLAAAMDSFDRSDLAQALAQATQAAKRGAGAAAYVLIGRVLSLQQDFTGAQAAYEEALRRAPHDAEAKRRLDRLRQALPETPP